MKKHLLFLTILLFLPLVVAAQTTIRGTVYEASSGDPIIGTNVYLLGADKGAATNLNGEYTIQNVEEGTYTIRVTSIGHETIKKEIKVSGALLELDFELVPTSQFLQSLQVFASRSDQSTPVAFTNVDKAELAVQLGSRDLPEVLNVTPSVYSTNQGGGSGDARINVRGFSQRNVAVLINGVPVNDMENGWVYWSNWDGVGDAARSLQVQRGISNVNLAVPSVGGTLNIITDPTSNQAGGAVKYENGSGALEKTTLMLNTGLIGNKFAFSFVGVRKVGDGLVEGTWTDAWSYHAAASYQINDNNRLDLYALGAPQRHGQNLYAQNIGTYDRSYALGLDGYDAAAADKFTEKGRYFNQNVAGVNPSYLGNQYIGDGWVGANITNRYDSNMLNERENFFHKPQVNLNWYSELSDKISLTNVLYYSGGRGGGTGTWGDSPVRDFSNGAYKILWDQTISRNQDIADVNDGRISLLGDDPNEGTILRNSRNNQWTIGNILKVTADLNENIELTAGIDWRTAEIEHYREIRDLLGAGAAVDYSDELNQGRIVGLGDKVAYNFTNTVDWIGGFVQGQYTVDRFSTYATAGISTIKYTHDNHFVEDPENPGKYISRESDNIAGYQVKAGALYSVSPNLDVFANVGAISKVPIFDNVINDGSGAVNEDPENEKFFFYEGGVRVYDNTGKFGANLNYYLTDRKDRSFTRGIQQQDGSDGIINIAGLDQRHTGIEFELSYQPEDWIRLDFATSHNLWEYQNDVEARYQPDESSPDFETVNLYIEGLKVGDAPQTQYAYTLNLKPTNALDVTFVGTSYLRHYSDFDPIDRDDASDRAQTWHVPNYTVFNLHLNYELPALLEGGTFFFNMFNLFDATYIQDATDNSRYNSFDQDHDADDAEVFFGLPRRYNFGIRLNF
ncbi:MAG: TonB-dependent receptor [Balneolaceae bacterium]|nr:TonB-dependent receptor [Balneolaceae bacterium]